MDPWIRNGEKNAYPSNQKSPAMYGVFTYMWWIYMIDLGKYTSPTDFMGEKKT